MTTAPFQLFDALPDDEYQALKASIATKGLLTPIARDQHRNVLDGHHRERACHELGIEPRYEVLHCGDDTERKVRALVMNLLRRHLTRAQKAAAVGELRALGYTFERIAEETGIPESTAQRLVAESDDVSHLGYVETQSSDQSRIVDSRGRVQPKRKHKKPRKPKPNLTVVQAKNSKEADRAGKALVSLGDEVPNTTMDTKRVERVARETAAEQRRAEPIEQVTVTGSTDIRHGDFRTALADIEPGTVDAIITDPPYPKQFWDGEGSVYGALGAAARTLLKPNGVLAVMIGTRLEMLDSVDRQIGQFMRRRHRAVYLTPGQRWRDQIERVATGYKPILIYSHPDADDLQWINDDVFTSSGTSEQDTRFHHWGQSESGFASLIERLTEPGCLVVDPFLGGGTTAVVCRDLGRRFIGCDIDAAHVATSRERAG
jgi:hypothetical protein